MFIEFLQGLYGGDIHLRPCQSTIEEFLRPKDFSQKNLEIFMGFATTAPVEIRTALHFWWWFDFCCKWQEIYFRGYRWFEKNLTEAQLEQGHYYPFGSIEFQQWSMNHMGRADVPTDYRLVKAPMLDYIFKFNKDHEYHQHKRKEPSQAKLNRTTYKNLIWEDFSSTDDIYTLIWRTRPK